MGGNGIFIIIVTKAFCPFPGEDFLLCRKVTVISDRAMRELRARGHRLAVARAPGCVQGCPLLVSGPASLGLLRVQVLPPLRFSLILRTSLSQSLSFPSHCPFRVTVLSELKAERGRENPPHFAGFWMWFAVGVRPRGDSTGQRGGSGV